MVFSYGNAGSGENLLFPVSGVGQLSNAKASATMFRGLLISPCCIQPFSGLNRPGFPGECFICELRLPDHRFRWKHNKLFLLLPEEYGPAFPAIVDCYTSPPT